MKNISSILLLVMIYLLCSADGCSEDALMKEQREQRLIEELKSNLKSAFESESVSDQYLAAYELTAQEKLIDFADYLKIVSDSSLDMQFRLQAAEMISRLFVPGKIETGSWSKVYPEKNLNTLNKLLDRSLSNGISLSVKPTRIGVEKPFMRLNDSTYIATLSFLQNYVLFDSGDSSESTSDKLFLDFFIRKRVKTFGKEQMKVWELYLGNFH